MWFLQYSSSHGSPAWCLPIMNVSGSGMASWRTAPRERAEGVTGPRPAHAGPFASRVPAADVLRVEERRQVAVDLDEPVAGAVDALARHRQPAVPLELVERRAELLADVHPVLAAEVVHVEVAGLQQQHDLADQPVAPGRRERPAQRQLVAVELLDVRLPG